MSASSLTSPSVFFASTHGKLPHTVSTSWGLRIIISVPQLSISVVLLVAFLLLLSFSASLY